MTFAFAKFDWTEAAVAEMTRLFHEGLSASQIAVALKIGSRSAVIGKLSRVGLTRGPKPQAPKRIRVRKRAEPKPLLAPPPVVQPNPRSRGSLASTMSNVIRHATNRANEGRGMEAPYVAPRIEIAQPLASNPITIFALHNGLCRWPLFDDPRNLDVDDTFYCGAPCDRSTTYCDHHGRASVTATIYTKEQREAFKAKRAAA